MFLDKKKAMIENHRFFFKEINYLSQYHYMMPTQ
jgi:hypothetical protein